MQSSPRCLHLQPAYADLGYHRGDFPQAEQAAAEVISLPLFPEMTEGQMEEVVVAVRRVCTPAGATARR